LHRKTGAARGRARVFFNGAAAGFACCAAAGSRQKHCGTGRLQGEKTEGRAK